MIPRHVDMSRGEHHSLIPLRLAEAKINVNAIVAASTTTVRGARRRGTATTAEIIIIS
jgi:hypothetical protein